MQVHVLGSAAGGGVPQWNCACRNCTAAREGRLPMRTQASLAASADGKAWVLFNVTTDIRAQLAADPILAPRSGRDIPFDAIFLTDANLDHAAGLLDFRQGGALTICSTALVRDTLLSNAVFAPFGRAPRRWVAIDEIADATMAIDGLRIRTIAVDGYLPSYAGGAAARGAVSAYLIEDALGVKVLYAPIFASIGDALAGAADEADIAIFDGSFWSDDELSEQGLGTRTAAEMGHQPVGGSAGSLAALAARRCPRKIYTHINNSNPMLDPQSPEAKHVRANGFEIAHDGMTIATSVTARA